MKLKHKNATKVLVKPTSNHTAVSWPTLGDEIGVFQSYLKGRVLNAGSGVPIGDRDITPYVNGEVYNLDVMEHELIHKTGSLDDIPYTDNFFDSIFCNAVLEHVKKPVEVVNELYRVLKPEGNLYLVVPFMQPEHLVPTDYQRYTIDGLKEIVMNAGFEIIEFGGVHNVYTTIGWVIEEWLNSKKSLRNTLLRSVLFPPLRFLSKNSSEYVHSIASAYRVLASKK